MSAGFLLDRGHGNSLAPTTWQDGPPEKSFWTGLKTKGHQQIPVTVYRCESCGFLESYAHALPTE
jgi:hypothetical protein